MILRIVSPFSASTRAWFCQQVTTFEMSFILYPHSIQHVKGQFPALHCGRLSFAIQKKFLWDIFCNIAPNRIIYCKGNQIEN